MYEIIGTEKVSLGRFEIIKDSIFYEGKNDPYSYVKIKSGVCIIPLLGAEDLLIIRQYRHSIKTWQYEFPCGMIDDSETPDEAAKRELLEETGYDAAELIPLGFTYPSVGSTTEIVYLFAAKCKILKEKEVDDLEIIENYIVSRFKLQEMILNEEIVSGITMTAWLKWIVLEFEPGAVIEKTNHTL